MSCVVGVVTEGGVCVGADSATSSDVIYLNTPHTGKLFRLGELVVAHTGNLDALQAARKAVLRDREAGEDEYAYLVDALFPALREAFEDADVQEPSGKDHGFADANYLIACGARLFYLFADLVVLEDARGYMAAGSGRDVALGVLWATQGDPPERRVRMALEAATEHCDGVRPPFVVEWTGKPPRAIAAVA